MKASGAVGEYEWAEGPCGTKTVKLINYDKVYNFEAPAIIEYAILANLSHPNIVECDNIWVKNKKITYTLKHYNCSLSVWSYNQDIFTRVKWFNHIFKQVCHGLKFLHSCRILHGDIKPSNIVINKKGEVALIDFDGASIANNESYKDSKTTYAFKSPEAYKRTHFGPANDIWSLGITMVSYIKKLLEPWMYLSPRKIYLNIKDFQLSSNPFVPQQITNIINRCLERDINKRATIDDILRIVDPLSNYQPVGCVHNWPFNFKTSIFNEIQHDPWWYNEMSYEECKKLYKKFKENIISC